MVDDASHLKGVVEGNVQLFATTTRQKLSEIDGDLAKSARLVALDAVPHTNSMASCQVEYDKFMHLLGRRKDCQEDVVRAVIEEPFAFVVLNAGFPVGDKKEHMPYTEREATMHGEALGAHLPAGTHLILAHGGPRNLKDIELGGNAMEAFHMAYYTAQVQKARTRKLCDSPYVICEPFVQGGCNMIKVGYVLARRENCLAFISNSEGYGTMDGAVLHVDNSRTLLGMFPFAAQYADPTGQRQANILKYNEYGVAVLKEDEGRKGISLQVLRHPAEAATPRRTQDAAAQIVFSLALAAPEPSFGPVQRPGLKLG
jgi:hypothetical protein